MKHFQSNVARAKYRKSQVDAGVPVLEPITTAVTRWTSQLRAVWRIILRWMHVVTMCSEKHGKVAALTLGAKELRNLKMYVIGLLPVARLVDASQSDECTKRYHTHTHNNI